MRLRRLPLLLLAFAAAALADLKAELDAGRPVALLLSCDGGVERVHEDSALALPPEGLKDPPDLPRHLPLARFPANAGKRASEAIRGVWGP